MRKQGLQHKKFCPKSEDSTSRIGDTLSIKKLGDIYADIHRARLVFVTIQNN